MPAPSLDSLRGPPSVAVVGGWKRRHGRRGRGTDLAWAHRLLLLHGYDTLSMRGRGRLDGVLAHDDRTQEIGAAWGVKEQLRLRKVDIEARLTRQAAKAETSRMKGPSWSGADRGF